MLNSILYFEQFCIKNFEKLEDEFLKNPKNFAEYVFGITDLLCKFGTEAASSVNRCFLSSPRI